MKMHDMGHKQETPTAVVEGKSKEPQITYSGFSMVGDQIPEELKDAKNGDMCRLEIVVKKIGDTIDTYTEGKPQRVEVEIHKLGYLAKAGSKTFEEYDKSSKDEKETHDKETAGVNEEEE